MGTSENTAGPSRLRGLQPDAGSSHSEDSHPYLPELDDAGEDTTNIADRPRIRRTGKACLPCRLRKRRCGGQPPDACTNCLRSDETCKWAAEDGRSSAVRKGKANVALPSMDTAQLLAQLQRALQNGNGQGWPRTTGSLNAGFLNGYMQVPQQQQQQQQPQQQQPSFAQLAGAAPGGYEDNQLFSDSLLEFNFFPDNLYPSNPSQVDSGLQTLPYDQMLLSESQLALADLGNDTIAGWTNDMDPTDLIMAMSSRLPTVEQSGSEFSPASDSVLNANRIGDATAQSRSSRKEARQFAKVTWWRPHGLTAIAPGLKRMTLKVRVNSDVGTARSPCDTASVELFADGRVPSVSIMRHLIEVFREHFGSQFPCLDLAQCMSDLEAGNGSVFLLNCIAAVSARFSTHPSIALPHLQPHEYGNVFFNVAKDLLGSMLAVPLRETIVALLLLCHMGFANDSEAEEWMFAGMAVRLAVDLGIHLEPGEEAGISHEDRRRNRLVFWSVVLLDFALSFGTGRQPSMRVSEITQGLPTDADMGPLAPGTTPHPFPSAARMMLSYGRLIELLNSHSRDEATAGTRLADMHRAKLKAIREYGSLPAAMRWNVTNLQRHSQLGCAPIFLQMHLWFHTIIASGGLTSPGYLRRPKTGDMPGQTMSGAITPNGMAAAHAWRHSARTIGEILVLSDVVCPKAYAALPFCNQAFFVAGSCFVNDLERDRPQGSAAHSDTSDNGKDDKLEAADLFKLILASVSTENIAGLRKGLTKQTLYWAGVAWVAEALEQRIQGIGASEIDLAMVTEKLASVSSIPDAGVLHRSESHGDGGAS